MVYQIIRQHLFVPGETWVVVIFNEIPQKGRISTVGRHGVNHIVQVADASTGRLESIQELIVAVELVHIQGKGE